MSIDPRCAPLALTMGDPAGIGPDITLDLWSKRKVNSCPPFVLFADPQLLTQRAVALDIKLSVALIGPEAAGAEICAHFADRLPVRPLKLAQPVHAGHPDTANAAAVISSVEQAVNAVISGRASAVVTNPIAKQTLYEAGFEHPGHTEFLGALATSANAAAPGTSQNQHPIVPVMMLASEELRVVPLTVHIPLKDVAALITSELIIKTAHITQAALRRDFGIKAPRLAITGLNPHAGEGGTMGREDAAVIAPAIQTLTEQGFTVTGPHPADTLFHAKARSGYDAVIAMYHDQALIPLKTLAFDQGVNVTLGLPFTRTSPDHGTAFDIAGSGTASPDSLLAALVMARDHAVRISGIQADGGSGGGDEMARTVLVAALKVESNV